MLSLAVMLAPGSVNHLANIVKGYAIAIGVIFAMGFVWNWWLARSRELRSDLAARASAVWARQLTLALQNPELAEPMLGGLSNAVETARYRNYVAVLVATADEILALAPTDQWRETLARALSPHRSHLLSAEARDSVLRDCSDAVRTLASRSAGA